METASGELNRLFEDKQGVESFVTQLLDEVESGTVNPIDILVSLKRYEYMLKAFKENGGFDMCMSQAKYEDDTFSVFGAKIQRKNVSSWDFKNCNDPELTNAVSFVSDRKKQLKAMVVQAEKDINFVYPDFDLPCKNTSETIAIILK